MQIKAAIAYKEEPGFHIETVEIEAPRPDEILVKIAGVGICHTDLVFSSGAVPYPFPAVFGHEGSGEVVAVGEDVQKVSVGDHVLITFRSCGTCKRCHDGDAPYCQIMPALNYTGRRPDGTSTMSNEVGAVSSNFFGQSSFSDHCITYERNVVRVSKDLPIEMLGPLGCGIQTGVGAVLRSLHAEPGSSIVIAGGGSVGLSAVMGAKIAQCAQVILIEPKAPRRDMGQEFGATHVIDPTTTGNVAKAIREIVPAGVDYALDTSGVPAVQSMLLDAMGSKATLGLVGVAPPGTPTPGEANVLMRDGQSIKGIIEGDSDPDIFLPELIEYFESGQLPFDRMVQTYPFEGINQAIADQHAGLCIKPILIP